MPIRSALRTPLILLLALALGGGWAQPTPAITILINDSPWFPGFEALVNRYQEETGNGVILNVTPFPGMLQRSLNAVTAGTSEFDLINLNEQWYMGFYDQGLVTPIREIDPDFVLDPEVIEYAYATRWDPAARYSTADGELYGLPINGNIQLFFYREDLFEQHGLDVPETWADVERAAEVLHDPPNLYAYANRSSPPDWEFQSFVHGFGGSVIELDEATGAWEVTIAQEHAVRALEQWLLLGTTYGPANYADISQADFAALMQSGRLAMAVMVGAAAPSFENPQVSTVVGNVAATVVPGETPEGRATMSGIWVMGIPANLPSERQRAALDFLEWALTRDAQLHYARAGAIPVRQDVYEELGQEPQFRWMAAMAESTPYIRAQPRLPETPQIIEALNRHVSQALLGTATPEAALQALAIEIERILEEGGHSVLR
jgi:multiple sugar transport system substrate-binding protein